MSEYYLDIRICVEGKTGFPIRHRIARQITKNA